MGLSIPSLVRIENISRNCLNRSIIICILFNTSGVRLVVGIEDNKSSNKSFVCVSKPNRFSVTFTGINSVISSKLSPKVIESASNKTCFRWVETSMTGMKISSPSGLSSSGINSSSGLKSKSGISSFAFGGSNERMFSIGKSNGRPL